MMTPTARASVRQAAGTSWIITEGKMMEPQESYKLIVEVEGERVYVHDAYSIEDLEMHLGDAEAAVDKKKNELLSEFLNVGNDYAV